MTPNYSTKWPPECHFLEKSRLLVEPLCPTPWPRKDRFEPGTIHTWVPNAKDLEKYALERFKSLKTQPPSIPDKWLQAQNHFHGMWWDLYCRLNASMDPPYAWDRSLAQKFVLKTSKWPHSISPMLYHTSGFWWFWATFLGDIFGLFASMTHVRPTWSSSIPYLKIPCFWPEENHLVEVKKRSCNLVCSHINTSTPQLKVVCGRGATHSSQAREIIHNIIHNII
jgi:hypothetical protein